MKNTRECNHEISICDWRRKPTILWLSGICKKFVVFLSIVALFRLIPCHYPRPPPRVRHRWFPFSFWLVKTISTITSRHYTRSTAIVCSARPLRKTERVRRNFVSYAHLGVRPLEFTPNSAGAVKLGGTAPDFNSLPHRVSLPVQLPPRPPTPPHTSKNAFKRTPISFKLRPRSQIYQEKKYENNKRTVSVSPTRHVSFKKNNLPSNTRYWTPDRLYTTS